MIKENEKQEDKVSDLRALIADVAADELDQYDMLLDAVRSRIEDEEQEKYDAKLEARLAEVDTEVEAFIDALRKI